MPRPLVVFSLLLFFAATAGAADESSATDSRIRELAAKIDALRAELDELKASQSSQDTPAPTRAAAPEALSFFGYAEAVYSRPRGNAAAASADLRRVVFGFGHEFDERTRFAVEAEWEHAIASSEDSGEAAIEQAYIEHDLSQGLRLRAGLFLMPLGIINEHHEPPSFYGVDRNLVETAIIPSTWREGGVALAGSTVNGFDWSAGLTTGFDLSKWDAGSSEGAESPLGAIHQEMQLAKAGDLSVFGAVKYTGLPGFAVGAGAFTGKLGQKQRQLPLGDARLLLWNAYAQWEPAEWQLSALYARGEISHSREFNASLDPNGTLVPAAFWGGYAQIAYRGFRRGSWALEPFLRYERVNTGSRYATLDANGAPAARPTVAATTIGASLRLTENVVFKFDYQDFRHAEEDGRFNLAMGYSY